MSQDKQDLIKSLNTKLDVESKLENKQYDQYARYTFSLDKIGFILPKNLICELIEEPVFTYIPKMPSIIEGLCNVRGNLVPVFNLHSHFNYILKRNKYLLVIGQGQNAVGVLLDMLPSSVEEDEIDVIKKIPSLPKNLDQFVFKALQYNNRIMVEYNHDEFFKSLCNNH